MKIEKVIVLAIKEVLKDIDMVASSLVLEHPAEEGNGDYASNVAMAVFKKSDGFGTPKELAEKIVERLKKNEKLTRVVERVWVAGPGFINFSLKRGWLIEEMKQMVEKGDDYGRGDWGKGKRVLIDYSSPNIAKRFSIGHLRSTIIGQALYNLYRFGGWEAIGDNHLGDWGTQFGMIMVAVLEKDLKVPKMSVDELEEEYVKFNARAKKEPSLRERAKEAFVRLEKGEKREREIWKQTVEMSIAEFDRIYDRLGIKIDYAYGESSYEELMPKVVEEFEKKGLVKKSRGAKIVETGHSAPAILTKSDGASTYFTRDLATIKFRRENPKLASDLYIYEVGAEQTLHFRQLFKAAEMVGWGKENDYVHVAHGLVSGKDGKKLSTRKGTALRLEDFLEAMVKKAKEMNPESAETVGIGAVKFFDLKHNPRSNYAFNPEKAVSMDGDTGPYLQYACVRAKRVREKGMKEKVGEVASNYWPESKKEETILRWLYRFGEVVEESAKNYSPNLLAEYLLELAKRFNSFYGKYRVLGSKEHFAFRFKMTVAVEQVLTNGLKLLGIEVPERM